MEVRTVERTMTRQVRRVVKIDEEKCDGCGSCAIACVEGALRIIDGKAKLLSETYCDGLGACLGECPQGAITVEERLAEDFNEAEIEKHEHETQPPTFECQGAASQEFQRPEKSSEEHKIENSRLRHWPVQLTLIAPSAPFLENADILLVADCVPFAYAAFHQDFINEHTVLVACPKLDDFRAHLAHLTQILKIAHPKSLTIVHMEVPCCSGLVFMAKQAIKESGIDLPLNEVMISVKGEVISTSLKSR